MEFSAIVFEEPEHTRNMTDERRMQSYWSFLSCRISETDIIEFNITFDSLWFITFIT
jgi:hypothetical protein